MKIGYFEARQQESHVFLAATTTLASEIERAFVSAGGSNPTAPVISLRNVSRMAGRKQVIHAISVGAPTVDHVVVDYSDGTAAANTTGLNTTDVVVEFESNGREWVLTRSSV